MEVKERLFQLAELSQRLDAESSIDSCCKTLEELDNSDNNRVVRYAVEKLKSHRLLSDRMFPNHENEINVSILINRIKTGTSDSSLAIERALTHPHPYPHVDETLTRMLLIKSVLKHSNQTTTSNVYQLLIDQLVDRTDQIVEGLVVVADNPTRYSNHYLASKYFKCVKLCLRKHSDHPGTQNLIKSILDRLVTSSSDNLRRLESMQPIDDVAISNALVNIYELLVYLPIFSNCEIQHLEELKNILIDSNNGHFKPDLIYSGVCDDTQQIEFNLTCLERCLTTSRRSFVFENYLNPTRLFWKLVSSVDLELVVEWLITSETRFLVYLLKYLKYLTSTKPSVEKLERVLRGDGDTTAFVGFLADLNAKLSSLKRSFPYNCTPLLKLLTSILNDLTI